MCILEIIVATMKRPVVSSWVLDASFLFGSVLASALPYVTGLGFYSDGWSYNSVLVQVSPQRIIPMMHALLMDDADIRLRPVQAAYIALRYRAFGLHPLPWHITDQIILGLAVVAFYLAMREVLGSRPLAFVVALVFGVLPHYSTDRVWATMAAGLCALFTYLGIFALARSVEKKDSHPKLWLMLAMIAMTLSVLSYEVEFGLIAATILVAAWRTYQRFQTTAPRDIGGIIGIVCLGAELLAVVIAKTRVETRIAYHHHLFGRFWELLGHAASQAFQFNLWTYGLRMPVLLAELYRNSALSGLSIDIAVLVASATALYLWRTLGPSSIPAPRTCLWLLVAGFVLFALGFGIFFPAIEIDFTTMGLANRVAIASAPGAACVLVSLAGLLSAALKPPLRAGVYAMSIGLICGANCLAMSGIGHFWVDGARRQDAIVRSVKANVHALPHDAILLLDGVCRYSGPAVVFEGEEASGPIQLALGDSSLSSDVIASNMHFGATTVVTTMYGQPAVSYLYGKNLFVFNVPRRQLTTLTSQEAAIAYLRAVNPSGDSGCPPAREGAGARVD